MRLAGRCIITAVICTVAGGSLTGAAVAKPKYTAAQKAAIRKQLKKQIKKNPAVIKRKSFVRRAALVNFVLPVTIRLRTACAQGSLEVDGNASSPANAQSGCTALNEKDPTTSVVNNTYTGSGNWANVDLGPSLGQRQVALGGSLAAEVQFSDSYDGGALGNVSVKLLPTTGKFLKSSSVPLLWNKDMSGAGTRSDANFASALGRSGSPLTGSLGPAESATQGCSDFATRTPAAGTTSAIPTGVDFPDRTSYNALFFGSSGSLYGFGAGNGLPGYPYYASAGSTTPAGYIPDYPGVDALDQLSSGYAVGNNDGLGPSLNPFPYSNNTAPGSFTPNLQDTIFRTNALNLAVAPQGVTVDGATGTSAPAGPSGLTNGPSGTQSYITGQSGGQANLFGNIPGKSDSIDVTVNLQTSINAIARIVDQDVFALPLVSGGYYPAGVFNCHQVWLGAVQNYIPGVRLRGQLRIAPAITKDGKLRIAKATVQTSQPSHVALTACLFPTSAYLDYTDTGFGQSNQTVTGVVPFPSTTGTPAQDPTTKLWPTSSDALPLRYDAEGFSPAGVPPSAPVPYDAYGGNSPSNRRCNQPAYKLVEKAGFTGDVLPYTNPTPGNGYTTNASGATVTVAGDITVPNLSVDVLIGDN